MSRWGNVVAVAALVIGAVALWRGSRGEGETIVALDRRVAALERQGRARPLFAPAPLGAPSPARPPAEVAEKMEQLHERLAALETEASERQRARDEQERRKQEDLKWARSAILDRGETPSRRLRALKMLRSSDERTHPVALAALEMIQRDDVEPDTRSDMISELKGLTFPEIKPPILGSLGSSHEDTRKEAVQVLRWFFDDPAVVAAVTRIRDQDPAPGVRREAAKRIEEWRAGKPPSK